MGKFIEVPDNIKKEFERVLTSGGLFKIVSQHPNYSGGVHYQILSTKPYEKNDFNKIVDKITDMIDKFDDKYDCSITWNFGYQDDKYISAGIDMRKMYVEDSCKDEIHPNGGHIEIYEVNGKKYKVYADFSKRAVIAENIETGEKHNLSSSGYISNEKTIKERIKMYFKDSDEELVEDAGDYIYLFPDEPAMGNYKNECRRFGLKFVGKNYFQGEKNLVIKGSKEGLRKYADFLGYDLHPDYLYKENEFAGDIKDSEVKDVSMEQEEKLHNILERDWTYLGKEGKEQVWQYTKQGYFPERVKSLRSIANDLISYVDMLDKKVYIKEEVKYDDSCKDSSCKDSINPKHQSLIQVINKLNKYKDSK